MPASDSTIFLDSHEYIDDTDDDIADFTISESVQNDDENANDIDILLSDNTKTPLPKAKSISSFVISPHRKSSIIDAKTGHKLTRSYSTWNELASLQQQQREQLLNNHNQITPTQSYSVIGLAAFISYIKSIFTKPILKASIAYFIASLAVYSPTISDLLGTSDSKHLTCTVVVYFHPSRSVGSMLQALMFVSYSLVFGIGLSLLTFFFISEYIEYENVSIESPFLIIITLFITSTSLGLISFWKHRVCKQTFNTACSLAAILIISCTIKVYSSMLNTNNSSFIIPWDKISSIISCVLSGCFISVFICFTLLKNWAKKTLIKNLSTAKFSIGDTLAVLCDVFISNDWSLETIKSDRTRIATEFKNLNDKLNKLNGPLEETMFECLIFGREKEYYLYSDLVASQKRLVADLGGLRRAIEFKWEMVEYYQKIKSKVENGEANNKNDDIIPPLSAETYMYSNESDDNIELETNAVEKPEELIELFLYYLGPSTKSFVVTMKEILHDELYNEKDSIEAIVRQYSESLSIAKELFEKHQKKAIDSLYKQDILKRNPGKSTEKINQEEVAATCGNFSFSITQFSTELETFLTILNQLLDYDEAPIKSLNFLKIWQRGRRQLIDVERDQILSSDITTTSSNMSINYRIWKILKFTRGVDFQFGFRVGLGALILGSLAFLDATRNFFIEWRGEWALVTFCIIMNKSLGGTTMTVKWRFLGTFVGAATAYLVWTLFYPNVIIMAIFGFLVSIPCFNIILNWKANNAFGRFILLTYNLTVLYSYSMSLIGLPDDGDWEGGGNPIIEEIAFHRYIGVNAGVIWAIIITMTLFPVTARGRIKRGLSVLWLRMGIIWKRGALNNHVDEFQQNKLDGLRGLNDCHSIMNELRTLLKQAPMELRLKGAFPINTYTKLMSNTEGILNAYENINSIVDIDPLLTPIESIVLDNLKSEINELQNCVFLIFYMLASAMKLGLPLASYPASTDNAMNKLLIKLADVRKTVESRKSIGKNAGLENTDFVLFYSYCLVTNSIVNELEKLMNEVAGLFGKIDEETLELT